MGIQPFSKSGSKSVFTNFSVSGDTVRLQTVRKKIFRAQFEVLKLYRMVSITESRYKLMLKT